MKGWRGWKAQHVMVCSAALGAFAGVSARFMPWFFVAAMCTVFCLFVSFFGMLVGYISGRAYNENRIRRLEGRGRAMEAVMREGVGGMGPLVSASAQAVADRVAVRMVEELFRNRENDEQRDAAITRGAQIVEEEIEALMSSIESYGDEVEEGGG